MPPVISTEDRATLDALEQLIHDPRTSPERQSELREEFFSIANAYLWPELCDGSAPKMKMGRQADITLIRHAESEANAGLPSETPAGIPLTARGHEQARQLARRFFRAPDLIVVSPFLRTQQTAAPLMEKFLRTPVEQWPVQEFTYLNPGLYRGTTEAQRGDFAREYWLRCDPQWNDGGGAESFAALIARIDELERRLRKLDNCTVIFTHGYFIKALLLRREQPEAAVDRHFMAAFRDGRKNNPMSNTQMVHL